MTDRPPEAEAPLVSVIMGTLDEEAHLRACLDALLVQRDLDDDQIEVLIADGGSSDGTREILDLYQRANPQVRWFENPSRIAPAAWNICLDHARGDVILLMGAHTVVNDDFVRTSLRLLDENPEAGGVGGQVHTDAKGYVATAIALALSSPFGVGNSPYRFAHKADFVETVAFGAYRKSVFEKIGRFREDLVRNADWEFNHRAGQAGFRLFISPEIQCTHYPRVSLGRLWKQQFRTSFEKVKVIQEHPKSLRLRHWIPSAFVATMIGGLLLGLFWKPVLSLWKLTLVAYAASSLVFSAISARNGGWRYLPALPVVFLTIHLSYGFGLIAGGLRYLISKTESSS